MPFNFSNLQDLLAYLPENTHNKFITRCLELPSVDRVDVWIKKDHVRLVSNVFACYFETDGVRVLTEEQRENGGCYLMQKLLFSLRSNDDIDNMFNEVEAVLARHTVSVILL